MKTLVTGADGFIGRNLSAAIAESHDIEVLPATLTTSTAELDRFIAEADAVVHLAGVNRPTDPAEFTTGNADFTRQLCDALRTSSRPLSIAFASSIQAEHDNAYGASKRVAEGHLAAYALATGASVSTYRLANVFGKWGQPNYNSVVATFCYNVARDLPIRIDDPGAELLLVYIDDVVAEFLRFLRAPPKGAVFAEARPVYTTSVGEVARLVRSFHEGRGTLNVERVGEGLARALYATYVSYLPFESFSYLVPKHEDPRGEFVEMLKTKDSGQVSFLTAHPGVTRGGHYHHSKTEKFLVIRGCARFRFRNIVTNDSHELTTSGEQPEIVETIPGWAHDITNIGATELVVMLWASEVFDKTRPDTIPAKAY